MVLSSRKFLFGSGALALGMAVVAYVLSPSQVPIHFGPSGKPDRFGDPLVVLLSIGLLPVLGLSLARLIPWLVRKSPDSLINLPHREYWLSSEHRSEAVAKVAHFGNAFGSGLNLLTIGLQIVIWGIGAAVLPGVSFLILTVAYALLTVWEVVALYGAFQLPRKE